MSGRRVALTVVTLAGFLTCLVCGHYVLADWARLNAAYAHFSQLSSAGADLRTLFVADAVQAVHRINCFADGVGFLLGALLAAVGVHGLCLLPPFPKENNHA